MLDFFAFETIAQFLPITERLICAKTCTMLRAFSYPLVAEMHVLIAHYPTRESALPHLWSTGQVQLAQYICERTPETTIATHAHLLFGIIDLARSSEEERGFNEEYERELNARWTCYDAISGKLSPTAFIARIHDFVGPHSVVMPDLIAQCIYSRYIASEVCALLEYIA